MTPRLMVSARMVAQELLRNRPAMVLLFLVPTVLYVLIYATTGERSLPYELSATPGIIREASERHISLLYIGSTGMCGLLAFLAFVLTVRPIQTDRRLVFEGYRAAELLGAKMLVVAAAAALVAVYVTALLHAFYLPKRPLGVCLGFLLGGLIYGFLGMVAGVISRRDLDGILAILLLVNVDPGWLQNPVLFANAENRVLIQSLPAHHPCQVAFLAGLTDDALRFEIAACAQWLVVLASVAAIAYRARIGIARRRPA